MKNQTLLSRRKYLTTAFRPDREYIDGRLIERNVAEHEHAVIQAQLAACLRASCDEGRVDVAQEHRLEVSLSRYRVPDLCLMPKPLAGEPVFTQPPVLCIEVLSKDDRMTDMQERIEDYLEFGVASIWLVDPRRRAVSVYTREGSRDAKQGVVRAADTNLELPLRDIFAPLQNLS
jgi:Uma2 family endonuclease